MNLKKYLSGGVIVAYFLAATPGLSAAEPITVGVGNITNTFDYTSESFDLLRYLQTHETPTVQPSLRFILVDHPSDAKVAISGEIDGSYTVLNRPPNEGVYFLLGLLALIPGILYLSLKKESQITYTNNVKLSIWRDGRRVAMIAGPIGAGAMPLPANVVGGEIWERSTFPPADVRNRVLEPLWMLVSQRLHEVAAGLGNVTQ